MRKILMLGSALPFLALVGCGGGGGVSSTPAPPVAAPPAPVPVPPPPAPAPPPPPSSPGFDTTEYRRSNAAAQAQALAAYQAGATGRGITAGVIDSGIDLTSGEFPNIHPASRDLAGSRGLQYEGDHGVVVSQVLLGAKNDLKTHGIAPDATLLVLRTDTPGSCASVKPDDPDSGCSHNDNFIAAGLDVARQAGAKVVNISLGGSPANPALRTAIDRATAAGVIIVISAGNDGDKPEGSNPDPLAQIALDPVARGLVIIAGATDATQTIASFSNRAGNGANNYLTALGSRVRFITNDGSSFLYSGTSFSAPVVAGAVALLAQAFPNLSSAQIVDLLYRTATDLGASGTDAVYGRGELNLARAFQPQGQTSLTATAATVSMIDNASLSTAMGDAGKAGLQARIKDGYDRDFTVDLAGTIGRQPQAPRLASALALTQRQEAVQAGATTLALSIGDGRRATGLTLSGRQGEQAQALAGAIASRIGRTEFALGVSRGSDGLIADQVARARPAFLIATDDGQARSAKAAFAVRRAVGGIGVSVAAETGDLRLWEQALLGARGEGYRGDRYDQMTVAADWAGGPVALRLAGTRMREHDTVLGGRFSAAFGGGGATSWFVDAEAALTPLTGWRLGGRLRQGWTEVPVALGRAASTLASQALAVDLSRDGLFGGEDRLALRWSRPLRVTAGGLVLTGLGQDNWLGLAPEGRETDWEASYTRPLWGGGLSLNAYLRQQPGNWAAAPDDAGAALRYLLRF